ncbi:NUDIX domain-containing protein [Dactylosporangium sp. NPDC049140]|uniref:NUDIX domain-containing protein n=1 Tax=Dactylosporangium sp. NPDC049140 TaxID=3155647 RepID=UPI0033D957EB
MTSDAERRLQQRGVSIQDEPDVIGGVTVEPVDGAVAELPPYLDRQDELAAGDVRGQGAMALVVSPEGIVLHLRDDKSWIPHPGCWSLFGGAVEDGENPDQTIVRELWEELHLTASEYRPLWRVVDAEGDGRLLTVFEVVTSMLPADMVLTEGQGLRAFSRDEALRQRLAPFCRRVLDRYPGCSGIR